MTLRVGVGVIGIDIDARPVVCADADAGRARAATERFGFAAWTTDWHEVVDGRWRR
jgi:hypothetical protein